MADVFTITDCRPQYVDDDIPNDGLFYEVRLYPTREAYHLARLRRYSDERRRDGSAATTFHELSVNIGPNGEETTLPCVGAIYIHRECIDAEIVSHEATHAALNLYRKRHRGVAALGRNDGPPSTVNEEQLARSIGRLSQAIVNRLWELDAWAKKPWPKGGGKKS